MTNSDVINNIALTSATVVSVPRRIKGESYEIPTCYFNVDVADNKATARYRIECDENIVESALAAVEKGNVGDFYGFVDTERPNVVIVRHISLTA